MELRLKNISYAHSKQDFQMPSLRTVPNRSSVCKHDVYSQPRSLTIGTETRNPDCPSWRYSDCLSDMVRIWVPGRVVNSGKWGSLLAEGLSE